MDNSKSLIAHCNAFKDISIKTQDPNVLISPYCIQQAIDLLKEAASLEAYLQLAEAFPGSAGSHPKEVTSFISMWIRGNVKQEFMDHVEKTLHAEVFNMPKVVGPINSWASANSGEKINEIIQDFDPSAFLIIPNGIYFKANWETEFKDYTEKELKFFNKKTQFMFVERKLKYLVTKKATVVQIPFESNKLKFTIILPNEEFCLMEIMQEVCKQPDEFKPADPQHIKLIMPIFKIPFNFDYLKGVFEDAGVTAIFEQGHIPKCSDDPTAHIGRISHATFLDVGLLGCEGAAITTTDYLDECYKETPPEPIEMVVDRPFMFTISDKHSVYFMGKYVKVEDE